MKKIIYACIAVFCLWVNYGNAQTTVSFQIVASGDDAYEKDNGDVEINKNKFELGEKGYVGLRFQNVGVPKGATVSSAFLTITASKKEHKDPSSVDISGELSAYPLGFISVDNNLSSRSLTSSSVDWVFADWDKDDSYDSPDLSSVVQEMVNQVDWSYGNALSFILSATGEEKREAHTFDKEPLSAVQLTITYTGGVMPADITDHIVNDADLDATNELQDLELNGNTLTLTGDDTPVDLSPYLDNTDTQDLSIDASGKVISLTDGGSVTINSDDADADPTNELQDWSTLPGIPGDILDGDQVEDADADPSNELQDIELIGNTLTLTDDVTPVDLSSYLDNTDTQDLSIDASGKVISLTDGGSVIINSDDADADPTNELQDWSTLPGIPGDILDGDQVEDADADPSNELQDIELIGNTLTLTDDVTPVDLSSFLDNTDTQDLSIDASGKVISLTDGGSVIINSDDADADPGNEFNTGAYLNGTILEIEDNGGIVSAELNGLKDNMGDHSAFQTIRLNNFNISNDGDWEGIFINDDGHVGVNSGASNDYGLSVGGDALINGANVGTGGVQGNTRVGYNALPVATGFTNSAFGEASLNSNTSGYDNTGVGTAALAGNTTGSQNSGMGVLVLEQNNGDGNTAIGYAAGTNNTTGNSNTFLGRFSNVASGDLNNATAVGHGTVVAQSNAVILGNNADVGIGTSAPQAKLDVVGQLRIDDGTQSNGYVLTSDADGLASWQPNTDLVDDADNDPTNELQDWTTLPGIPGDILDGDQVNDADADPTNEFNTGVVLNGTDLEITDGGGTHTVDLSTFSNVPETDPEVGLNEVNKMPVWNGSALVEGSIYSENNLTTGIRSSTIGSDNTASAYDAIAIGAYNTASGEGSIAIGHGSVASGEKSTAMGFNTSSTGFASTAIGDRTNADGAGAFSTGYYNFAIGNASVAFGASNSVNGENAMVGGQLSYADGKNSFAVGYDVGAGGISSFAAGHENRAYSDYSTVMGRGSVATGEYGIAMGRNVNAGGIASLAAGLGSVASGNYSVALGIDNQATIGEGTVAIGSSNTANATAAVAIGSGSQATADHSIAIGYNNQASAPFASSIGGRVNLANGLSSLATGHETISSGFASTSTGLGTQALGDGSFASGEYTVASGGNSVALGSSSVASGANSMAFGLVSTASGYSARAFGFGSHATADYSTAIGQGITSANYGELHNGGDVRASSFITTSDLRYKKNIRGIESALDKVMKLRGVSYEFKNEEFSRFGASEGQTEIGFIAQDVQKVLPELVSSDGSDDQYLGIRYANITAVLVEAMKEQQAEIEELKKAGISNSDYNDQLEALRESNAKQDELIDELLKALKKKDAQIDALINQIDQMDSDLQHCCLAHSDNANQEDSGEHAYLEQNAPNPFNQKTVISYYVPQKSTEGQLIIRDLSGKKLMSFDLLEKGYGQLEIDAYTMTAGTYFYEMMVDNQRVDTKKMVVVQ